MDRMHADPQRTKSERTRAAILKAATRSFFEKGYELTTVREIAANAGIDPAMVIRYFGSKDELFARATAFDLRLPDLSQCDRTRLGAVLIAHFLDVWEGPLSNGSLVILLRTATSNERAAAKMREIFARQVMPMLQRQTSRTEAPLRSGLIASQLLGLALGRYVLKLPPLVGMTAEQIEQAVGPVLQQYLTAALPRRRPARKSAPADR